MTRNSPILLCLLVTSCGGENRTASRPVESVLYAQFTETIGGTAVSFDMMPVLGDAEGEINPFWIGRTEVTWNAYDVFLYGLDMPDDELGDDDSDAITRPSKPYISMDRGFGHAGYPVISVSSRGAAAFCTWLSLKTGRRYRLPLPMPEGDVD